MKQLDSFLKKNQPNKKVGKLKKYQDEIIKLYDLDFQIEQIQEFLKNQNIEITTRRIYQFLEKVKGNLINKNFSLETPIGDGKNQNQNQGAANENSKATNAYYAQLQKLANQNKD